MKKEVQKIQDLVEKKKKLIVSLQEEMAKVIVGQEKLINRLLVSLFTRGHILLEGVPGLAKTTAISTLAQIIKVSFKRIQFTPDLLPSDLIGSRIFNAKSSAFSVKKGPIFAHFILADEINRSPAKVQSALLEAMQEGQVTIGEETFALPHPFLVMATQNPIEQEGTYPLPEAQVDRFLLKTVIEYPTKEEELEIMNRLEVLGSQKVKPLLSTKQVLEFQTLVEQVYMDESVKQYVIDLIFASRFPQDTDIEHLSDLIAYGGSPRASIGLMKASKAVALLAGRAFVIPEDVKEIALDILRHRVIPTYEAEAEGVTAEQIIQMILDNVKVP